MAQLVVRNLEEDVKLRLRARAARHGRSLEAEVREILQEAALHTNEGDNQDTAKSLGELMRERFGNRGLTKLESYRFRKGIRELNSRSEMRIPIFDE